MLLNDYETDNRCKLWGYEAACSCEQPKNRLQIDEIKVVACCGDLKTDPSKVHVLWDLRRSAWSYTALIQDRFGQDI